MGSSKPSGSTRKVKKKSVREGLLTARLQESSEALRVSIRVDETSPPRYSASYMREPTIQGTAPPARHEAHRQTRLRLRRH